MFVFIIIIYYFSISSYIIIYYSLLHIILYYITNYLWEMDMVYSYIFFFTLTHQQHMIGNGHLLHGFSFLTVMDGCHS